MKQEDKLLEIYKRLYRTFGPQYWWPGETPFEIAVGAILTQNTNWGNVERAIKNLKREKALSAKGIHEMTAYRLSSLIRPAGYFNIKAQRLRAFIDFLMNEYHGSMKRMGDEEVQTLRTQLLTICGIGPETADSILLYALEKPVFIIDAYTRRVLSRHNIIRHDESYEKIQKVFHSTLKREARLFNEYHALLVRLGKTYCRTKPRCKGCPLEGV